MARHAAVFRSEAELKAIQARGFGSQDEGCLIALTPEADYLAERLGLDYRTIESFVDQETLEQDGVDLLGEVIELIGELDAELQQALRDHPEMELESNLRAQFYIPEFKKFFDSLFYHNRVWKAIVAELKCEEVFVCGVPGRPVDFDGLWNEPRKWELFLQLLDLPGVKVTHIQLESHAVRSLKTAETSRKLLLSLMRQMPHWLLRAIARIYGQALKIDSTNRGAHWVQLLVDFNDSVARKYLYEWMDLGSVIAKAESDPDIKFETLDDALKTPIAPGPAAVYAKLYLPRVLKRVQRRFFKSGQVQKQRLYQLMCVTQMQPVFKSFIAGLSEKAQHFLFMRDLVRKKGPASVLLASGGLMAKAVQIGGSQVGAYMHSPALGYFVHPLLNFDQLLNFDCVLSPGRGGQRYQEQVRFPGLPDEFRKPNCRVVGSASLKRIAREAKTATTRPGSVLYISNAFVASRRYFSHNVAPEIGHWRLQRAVAEACSRYDHIQLSVKLFRHPDAPNPLGDYLRDQGIQNCEIIDTGMLVEMIQGFDAFIVDYVITPVIETAATGRPLIVLEKQPFNVLSEEGRELLAARADLQHTEEGFIEAIHRHCQKDQALLDSFKPDPAFLREFGNVMEGTESADAYLDWMRSCG